MTARDSLLQGMILQFEDRKQRSQKPRGRLFMRQLAVMHAAAPIFALNQQPADRS